MQLLFEKSNEFGLTKGLGLIKGNVTNFPKKSFKVSHIGWEKVRLAKKI